MTKDENRLKKVVGTENFSPVRSFFSLLCLLSSVFCFLSSLLWTQPASALSIQEWLRKYGYGGVYYRIPALFNRRAPSFVPVSNAQTTVQPTAQPVVQPIVQTSGPDLLRDIQPWVESERATGFTYSDGVVALAQLSAGNILSARRLLDPYLAQGTSASFAGFHDRPDVLSTSIAIGPNAWLLMAGVEMLKTNPADARYGTLARNLANWLTSQQTGNGGLLSRGGPGGVGAHYGTEQNLAAHAALTAYARWSGQTRYQQAADGIRRWLSTSGVVQSGTGTVFVGTDPVGRVDRRVALDGTTMMFLSLGPQAVADLFGAGFLNNLIQRMEGFRGSSGFALGGRSSAPSYSNEGTAQVAAVYQRLAAFYKNRGETQKADDYQAKARALVQVLTSRQVSRGAIPIGWGLDWSGYTMTNNAQGESPAATAWYLFSRLGKSPLE